MFLPSLYSSLPSPDFCYVIFFFSIFFPSVGMFYDFLFFFNFSDFLLTRSGSSNRPSHRFLASHTGFDWFNYISDPISRPNQSYPRFTVRSAGPAGLVRVLKLCFILLHTFQLFKPLNYIF